jgi:MFS family permease
VAAMVALAAATSFLVGNAFQSQMPEFAHDLGTGQAGLAYTALLGANAAGAVLGGILLESLGLLRSQARTAVVLAAVWCGVVAGFAVTTNYLVALALLFLAGLLQLAYSAMAQTVVQLQAPAQIRGRVLGLFNMAQLGLRIGSGFTVGVMGNFIGVHWSLAISAAVLRVVIFRIFLFLGPSRRAAASPLTAGEQ